MGLQQIEFESRIERPNLEGRLLLGRMWNPETEQDEHVLFQFEAGNQPYTGTIKGGPVAFGTFLATWEDNHLMVDWRCLTTDGFVRGRTYASVERVAGNRVRVIERWIEHGDQSRPGFLVLEEPMSDVQS